MIIDKDENLIHKSLKMIIMIIKMIKDYGLDQFLLTPQALESC